jgi:endoglucanase
LQYHYYSPYDFIFGAWGKTIWGSDADKQALSTDLAAVRNNFTDVPLVIGEWSAAGTYSKWIIDRYASSSDNHVAETAARWKYADYLIRTAAQYNTSTFWWDNGATDFDRTTGTFRDPVVPNIIVDAAKGEVNSLADSTEDTSAMSQVSDAYLYHTAGTAVADLTATYILNGNTVSMVHTASGTMLEKGTDYTVSGSNVTLKASLISQYIKTNTPAGPVANFTIYFTEGAALDLTLVNFSKSTLATKSSTAGNTNQNLVVPVTYGTIPKVAAVQATLADGTCLFDTWTIYLPEIQHCRATYSGQWDYDENSVTFTAASIQAAVTAGQTTTFVVEFFPRMPGNNATYTLTV